MRYRALMLLTLALGWAIPAAAADAKTGRKKVEVDFFWSSNLTTTDASGLDRSLNPGKDAFNLFARTAKEWQGPDGWGAGGGTRENQAEIWSWGTSRPQHKAGETVDLFSGRTVGADRGGTAFGLNLRIATGDKWRATVGYSQSRKTTVREDSFRDYMTVDNYDVETLWCSQPFCEGRGQDLTTYYLSRHYRAAASTTSIRTHVLSMGVERELASHGRVGVSLVGGLDVWVYHIARQTTVRDYDYTRFYPEGIWLGEGYSGHLADYRTETGSRQRKGLNLRVQPRPYLGTAIGFAVCPNFGLNAQGRWYPLAKDFSVGHDSILGAYSTLTRPERFTLTAGATLAF